MPRAAVKRGVWQARIDRYSIRLDQDGSETDTETGFVRVWGQASQVGTLVYGVADGAPRDGWTEFVPPETIFEQAALDTLINAPVTLQHPPEFLDASNTARFQIGSVIELAPLPDEGVLRIRVLLTEKDAIDEVRSGREIELSLGYTALVGGEPGEFEGVAFDAIQLQRRYNHLAIVTVARAGPANALDRVDAHLRLARLFRADGLRIQLRTGDKQVSGKAKKRVDAELKIGDATFTVDEAVADAFGALQDALDEATAAADSKDQGEDDEDNEDNKDQGEEDEREGEEDSKTDSKKPLGITREDVAAMLKDHTKHVVDAMGARDRQVKEDADRLATVIAQSKTMLSASYQTDGKPAMRIMADAVIQSSPKLKAETQTAIKSKHEGQVRGLFDAARILSGQTDERTKPDLKEDKAEVSRLDKALEKRAARTLASRKLTPIKNGRTVRLSEVVEANSK